MKGGDRGMKGLMILFFTVLVGILSMLAAWKKIIPVPMWTVFLVWASVMIIEIFIIIWKLDKDEKNRKK